MNELLCKMIDAGGRFSTRLEVGQLLRIIDLQGRQAVDFPVYAGGPPVDRYNAANTMKINGNVYLGKARNFILNRPKRY